MAEKSTNAAQTPDPSREATELLLKIFRNVDREVKTTIDLGEEALRAVERFRCIAAALKTHPISTYDPTNQSAQDSKR